MAIVVSALATGNTTDFGATTITLSSSTPSGSACQDLVIYAQSKLTPTVDGSPCGLTFVQVATASNPNYEIWIFRAHVGSPSTGQPTITWSANVFAAARMVEATGVKLTGSNGADSVVQNSAGQVWQAITTGATETLAAFADATNNAAVFFCQQRSGSDATAEGGYTKLATYVTTYFRVECEYLVGQDLSPSMTWGSHNSDGGAMALELAAASTGSFRYFYGGSRFYQAAA